MTTRAQNYDRALSMHHRGCPVVVARCAATNAWTAPALPKERLKFLSPGLPVLASVLLAARCGAPEEARGGTPSMCVSNFVSNFVLLRGLP